jgi:pyruvate dehydrogenase E2 component (dihydrolipoamide acetyltransferase)
MQITTPDIGVDKATVAEILVKVGDSIAENDSLVLLESDKALLKCLALQQAWSKAS